MKKLLFSLLGSLFICTASAEAPELATACTACHGQNGVSDNTMWPNLAGQQVDYLAQQTRQFRDGGRVDSSMPAALLDGVSDEDIMQLALYYNTLAAAKPATVEEGIPGANERAYCVSCHGMTGNSVTSLWPNLSAQKEGYLNKQLLDYKSGARVHPVMQVIANELTEKQVAEVAKYYSQH